MREKLISGGVLFSFYEVQRRATNGQDSLGALQRCTGLWTTGCWLARRLHEVKPSTMMDLGILILFLHDVRP